VAFSDDNFGPSAGTVVAAIGGTTVGTIVYKTFVDAANVLFGGVVLTAQGPFGPGAFSGTATGALALPADFSLTQAATIHHSGKGNTSFNATLTVPDAGSTVALLGCALVGVEGLRRKFRK
jgi:hypothetical protein